VNQEEQEQQPAPVEPGHVMSHEAYQRLVEAQQK